MDEFWGNALQPVAVSLATVAILALLRLITPSVRWARRLKAETEVFSAIPEGPERELWSKRIEAQAERLRLYRENFSWHQQVLAWYAFIALTGVIVTLIVEGATGWPLIRSLTAQDIPIMIPFTILLLMSTVIALIITVKLVTGGSISTVIDGRGRYPKMEALTENEYQRRQDRRRVGQQVASFEYAAERERIDAKRAARRARRKASRTQEGSHDGPQGAV